MPLNEEGWISNYVSDEGDFCGACGRVSTRNLINDYSTFLRRDLRLHHLRFSFMLLFDVMISTFLLLIRHCKSGSWPSVQLKWYLVTPTEGDYQYAFSIQYPTPSTTSNRNPLNITSISWNTSAPTWRLWLISTKKAEQILKSSNIYK